MHACMYACTFPGHDVRVGFLSPAFWLTSRLSCTSHASQPQPAEKSPPKSAKLMERGVFPCLSIYMYITFSRLSRERGCSLDHCACPNVANHHVVQLGRSGNQPERPQPRHITMHLRSDRHHPIIHHPMAHRNTPRPSFRIQARVQTRRIRDAKGHRLLVSNQGHRQQELSRSLGEAIRQMVFDL